MAKYFTIKELQIDHDRLRKTIMVVINRVIVIAPSLNHHRIITSSHY